MTMLEQRLREQLPELADAWVARATAPDPDASTIDIGGAFGPERERRLGWRPLLAIAAATLLVIVGGLVVLDRRAAEQPAPATTPATFGTWRPIADAPIPTRPYAVSGWTGTEALFWAGSSLSRGFAFTDGALYDPATDSWRTLAVPGWGHPGLTGVFLDGQLYALAKGGGVRLDVATGEWTDLARVETMFLAATVATDDAVWGIGPAALNAAGQPDLAIARYEPDTDSWTYGPTFDGTAATADAVAGLSRLETDVVWTGAEIVAWDGRSGGVAFDPATATWRTIEFPEVPDLVRDSHLTVTDAGPTAIVEIHRGDPAVAVLGVAVESGGGWQWLETQIPVADPETLTVAPAGDWVVLFSGGDAPVTVHAPTGRWMRHDDGPLAGLAGPNTVWTGSELVVWGGEATPSAANPAPADGAAWTPPPSG